MIEWLSAEHLSPFWSSLLIDGFGTLAIGIVVVIVLRRRTAKLREAQAADRAADTQRQLAVGPCILSGKVDYAQGSKWAVRIDVDQEGEESESSGTWSFKWTEKNRRVHVAPFYVRLASGQRIRVEPTTKVRLVDAMDGVVRIDLTKRTRYAELVPGETIYAVGQLVRANDPENIGDGGDYRNAPGSLVLRPLLTEPMLLSSEPLGDRYRERAAFHGQAATWIAVCALVLHVAFLGFHIRRYMGQTDSLPIIVREEYVDKNADDRDITLHRIKLQIDDQNRLEHILSYNDYSQVKIGDNVPVRRIQGVFASMSTIGPGVTAHASAFVFPIYLLIAWFVYLSREKATRPWYERKVNEAGSGRLEDSLAAEQGSPARS